MPEYQYFLDWVPRPTTTKLANVTSGEISVSSTRPEFKYAVKNDSISYWYRSDGFLLFRIEFKQDIVDEFKNMCGIATQIVGLIKEKCGHTHVFDTDRNPKKRAAFPILNINPINIDDNKALEDINTSTQKSIGEEFKSEQFLMSLMGFAGGENRAEAECAVFLIRIQFAKIFNKTLQFREKYQERRIEIGRFKTNFKLYHQKFPLLLLFLMIPAVTIFAFLGEVIQTGDTFSVDLSKEKLNLLLYKIGENVLSLTWPIIVVIYILLVSIKRRKILLALRRGRGMLKFGSILNDIVVQALSKTDKQSTAPSDFSKADDILANVEELETRKRWQTQTTLLVVGAISFAPTLKKLQAIAPGDSWLVDIISVILAIR